MERLKQLLKEQPAFITAIVEAGLAMAMAFGLNWDAEQVATVTAFVNILGGAVVFMLVMPMSKVRQIQSERDTAYAQAQEARDVGAWLLAEKESQLDLVSKERGPLQQGGQGFSSISDVDHT